MSELQPHIQVNNLTLKNYLGAGQFGEVWSAFDYSLKKDVAVKFYVSLDPKGRKEFFKEYELASGLTHENLLTVSQIGEYNRRPYLVMDYCSNGAASKLVGDLSPQNEEIIWHFIANVAAGLQYLHNKEIVHQDIKPENILLSDEGRFVIADFGISTNARATMRKQSGRSQNAGATAYMAPERFNADPMIIKASDIWSLGASIYELATGKLPFSGLGGVMQKNGAEIPEIISKGYSQELNALMQKCLALEPWDRIKAEDILALIPSTKNIDMNIGKHGDPVVDLIHRMIQEDKERKEKPREAKKQIDVEKQQQEEAVRSTMRIPVNHSVPLSPVQSTIRESIKSEPLKKQKKVNLRVLLIVVGFSVFYILLIIFILNNLHDDYSSESGFTDSTSLVGELKDTIIVEDGYYHGVDSLLARETVSDADTLYASELRGHSGDLRVNLQWYSKTDLDLQVVDPCGNKTCFSRRKTTCGSGTGNLDLDANAIIGTTTTPQENIYWIKPKTGIYIVRVICFKWRDKSLPNISFNVSIVDKNGRKDFSGIIGQGETVEVIRYNYLGDSNNYDVNTEIEYISNQGNACYNVKNVARALTYYNKALALNPDYVPAKEKDDKCNQLLNATSTKNLSLRRGTSPDGANKLGFVDANGYVLIDYLYAACPNGFQTEYGICLQKDKNSKYGFIDNKTKLPCSDFVYNSVYIQPSYGFCCKDNSGKRWKIVLKDSTIIMPM